MNHLLLSLLRKRKLIAVGLTLSLALAALGPYAVSTKAAGPFGAVMVRLDRIKASTATGGRVCAKPSVANLASTEAFVEVTFPAGFTVNGTAGNWTVTTTGLDTGQTAWPSIATATNVTSQTVRFPSGDLSSSSLLYCFNFSGTTTLTTTTAGNSLTGTVETKLTGPGAVIDSTQYATSIIADDQIVVTASVGATFTFALSGNTDTFSGNLDPATVKSTAGKTVTVTTNAASGWVVWAKDSQNNGSGVGSLHSTVASKYIAGSVAVGSASRTLSTGTEDYGLGVTINTDAASGGVVTLDANYDGNSTKAGTLDPTAYRPIASASGTAAGDIINLIERATISNSTPAAGDYTDTITVVGAGSF